MAESRQLVLGRIGGPYGIKGWVKLISYTEPLENILDYRHWQGRSGRSQVSLEMDAARPHGKGLIAHFVGYDDPESARRLNDIELTVPASQLPELDDDEFYWHELTGLRVVTASGHVLGRVARLLETGANDVLVVEATDESVDDRERLIPWLPGATVLEVVLPEGRMTVDWEPDYLA